jgi:hypothetical protein
LFIFPFNLLLDVSAGFSPSSFINSFSYTVRSESRRALRLRYVDLVVSIEVAVDNTSNSFYKCTANFRTQICRTCLRTKLTL